MYSGLGQYDYLSILSQSWYPGVRAVVPPAPPSLIQAGIPVTERADASITYGMPLTDLVAYYIKKYQTPILIGGAGLFLLALLKRKRGRR